MKKSFSSLLLSIFFTTVHAQSDSLSLAPGSFAALIVEDIDTAKSWYTNVLGFTITHEDVHATLGIKQANLQQGDHAIELIETETAVSLSEAVANYHKKLRVQGLFKIGLHVLEFERWINHFEANNVTFQGRVVLDPISAQRMVIILDPDGNRIQIFEK